MEDNIKDLNEIESDIYYYDAKPIELKPTKSRIFCGICGRLIGFSGLDKDIYIKWTGCPHQD